MENRLRLTVLKETIMKKCKGNCLLKSLSIILLLTSVLITTGNNLLISVNEFDDNSQDIPVSLEDVVEVTMSSLAMPATSVKLNTGDPGTHREKGWLVDDPIVVEFRNTLMEPLDLNKRTDKEFTIVIDEYVTYQEFAELGASMDYSTVWNLMKQLENQRKHVLSI